MIVDAFACISVRNLHLILRFSYLLIIEPFNRFGIEIDVPHMIC